MRRPLKPFVTEYKGTRRQAPGAQAPSLQSPPQSTSEPTPRLGELRAFDTERSRSKPAASAAREDLEDSYEAAMRAADALFARPAPQVAQRPISTEFEAVAEGSDAVASSVAPDRSGRILRALDEPPPPQLVALEAAHAPKRRGRKPGSKNKPKITAQITPVEVTDADMAGVHPAAIPASGMSEAAAPRALQATRADTTQADTTRADTAAAQRRLEAIPVTHSPSNGSKRFSWVRDRLKPGEGWKRRRLPRICW